MNSTKKISRPFSLRQISIIGMMSAISIILGLTGYGFIPLPTAKATIMHIPVIIGAILEGPLVGATIGLIFGLFSLFQNITAPNLLSFAFINPLVSVLPRVLIGLVAYYTYKLIAFKSESIRVGFAAALGTLTNTIGVLTMIYLLYAERFAHAKGIAVGSTLKLIYGIAVANGIPEMIIAILITIPIVASVKKIKKH